MEEQMAKNSQDTPKEKKISGNVGGRGEIGQHYDKMCRHFGFYQDLFLKL